MTIRLFAFLVPLLVASVQAQLVITEVNSNGTPSDFWELTNFGAAPVDLSGYRWVDDVANPADVAALVVPANTVIAPQESILFVTEVSAQDFRTAWNLGPTVQIITGGPGLGLNDAVFLYNTSSQLVTGLNYRTTTLNGVAPFVRSNGQAALGGHAGASAGGESNQSLILDPNFGTGTGRRYIFATGVNFSTYAASAPNDGVGSPGRIGVAGNSPPFFTGGAQGYWRVNTAITTSWPFRVVAREMDANQTVTLSVVSKPSWLTFASVSSPAGTATWRLSGTPPTTGNHFFTVRATDNASPAAFTERTYVVTVLHNSSPIILNEYNAVGSAEFLRGGTATVDADGVSPAPSDSFFGRVAGNGGEWVEFVVVGTGSASSPRVDMRGWTIEVHSPQGVRSIVLSQDPYWQSVVAGTILTFTASNSAGGGLDTQIHRTSALHNLGFLSTNVWIHDRNLVNQTASTFTSTLGISSEDSRFVVKNAAGTLIYGPSGEGVASVSGSPGVLLGVNSREVLRLQQNPAPAVDPLFGTYNDSDAGSTFGARNSWGTGPTLQSFASYVVPNSPPVITSSPVTRAYGGYSYTISTSDPNGQAVNLTQSTFPSFLTLTGNTLANNRPLTLADAGDYVIRIVASDGGAIVTPQVFTLTVFHDKPTVILNEYNAVAASNFLNGGTAEADSDGPPNAFDTHFGRVAGNGGRWFELVVVGDGGPSTVDMRGWSIEIANAAVSGFTPLNTLKLSQNDYWAAVPAGTILTFIDRNTANGGLDTGINLRDRLFTHGDLWTNVWMGDPALLTYTDGNVNGYTIGNGMVSGIRIDQNDTQFILKNAVGQRVFGPVGEGIAPLSGVSSTEVFELENHPSPAISPLVESIDGVRGYDDGGSGSTFGNPNRWSGAGGSEVEQDFTRYIVAPPKSPYELWAESFGLSGQAVLFSSDPDGDGRSNLEEYAFGGNPTVSDEAFLPQQIRRTGGTVVWQYIRRQSDPLLDFFHYESNDLINWTPLGNVQVALVPHPAHPGFSTATVELPAAVGGARFFRAQAGF
jgi:hypothetical protein